MGLVGQILGKQKKVQFLQNDATVIELDCTISEKHSRETTATQFEVEDGTTISDHLIVKNFALEIEGIISDTPLSDLGSLLNTAIGAVLPPVGVVGVSIGKALFSAIFGSDSPSVQAYQKLLDIQKARQSLSVITTLQRYDSMYITNISAPRDAGTGQILLFTMSLQQLRIVKPQTVNIQIFKNGDLAGGKANLGKQNKENALAAQFDKGQQTFNKAVGH